MYITVMTKLWDRMKHFKLNIMNYSVFLQICAGALAFIHLILMIAIGIGGQVFLSRLNILSILVYMAAFYYAGKNRIRLVYFMFITEVLIYSALSVYILGESTQFGLYCLAVIPFTFLTGFVLECQNPGKKLFHPVVNYVIICVFYFAELSMGNFFEPRYTIESAAVVNFLRIMNMLINLFCIIFGCGVLGMVAAENTMTIKKNMEEMERLMHQAEASNEAKSAFLANMSHEIRTPMNAICGMTDMLLDENLTERGREYATTIKTSGEGLLSIINDILDFSKIESGKMELVPVEYDISSLIHDLANMTSQRAKDKNIRLELEIDHEIPARLYGDDVRLRQVLTNILTNAVKYTRKGTVWLRVRCHKTENTAALLFEVEDTGIGIKEEDLPKLFTEFERIEEDRNRNIEGTGLGMSITIQLLALLGSRLQVESTYGKGSKFYFELKQKIMDQTPIGDFESRVRQIAENYNYSAKLYAPDAKILTVDDNAVNRRVLRNLLKATQIQITDAGSGAECLELVQKNHYDLIFLDHMMPEMDGVETLYHIKEFTDFPCQDTPIIVLTANAVSGMKEKYLSEGFDDFLSKPIVPEKLETMIQKMLPEELLLEAPDDVAQSSPPQPSETGIAAEILEALPLVDGLDWQYAWLHLPDMDLLEYTVKEFYSQIEPAADNLEQAFEQIGEPDALEQYRIQVHAMKSLAATIGILPLSGTANILEYAARDGKIDVLKAVTPVFLEEWRSYRQKLQGVFGLEDAPKEEVTDYSVILALVEMVRISMQEMDIDQADTLIHQMQTYEYPEEIEQNIRKLADAVTNLDPEETNRLAGLLIGQMENAGR